MKSVQKAARLLDLLSTQRPAAGLGIIGCRQTDDKTWKFTKAVAPESVRTGTRTWKKSDTRWHGNESTMRGNYQAHDSDTVRNLVRDVARRREEIAKMSK